MVQKLFIEDQNYRNPELFGIPGYKRENYVLQLVFKTCDCNIKV